MSKTNSKYDVAIIGAGIGGLVAGCYLAKAGKKVLIIEKHVRPGGYCSSFSRKKFTFDSCIHFIKIAKKRSFLNKVFEDLGVYKHVEFNEVKQSDLIIAPAGNFFVYNDVNKTIQNLINIFPDEANNIVDFFNFLNTDNTAAIYSGTYKKNFDGLVRSYFKKAELISVLDSLLMNIGLPINKAHALKAYYFFKEFFFAQSYYPKGGIQKLPDALNKIFHDYGGKTLYGTMVDKIQIGQKIAKGIVVKNETILADTTISNVDPYSTFFKLVGKDNISVALTERIKKIKPSISAYILYLGLSNKVRSEYSTNGSIWYFPEKDFSAIYADMKKRRSIRGNDYLICSFPSSHDKDLAPDGGLTLSIVFGAPFKTKDYWEKNKKILADDIINRAGAIFPNIKKCLKVTSIATPQTLFEYTNNYEGACYGLASIKKQMAKTFMPQRTEIENLLMAGHWTTHGIGQGGLSMVAYSGFSAANKVLEKCIRRDA